MGVKERPILFSAPMVRAILEGRKTQTRRIVKPQPDYLPEVKQIRYGPGPLCWPIGSLGQQCGCPIAKFPYGHPGDRLWVRETWKPVYHPACEAWENVQVNYRAGGFAVVESSFPLYPLSEKWKPSIHMPRWASRINLEITGIRVERLQDIKIKDIYAEGAISEEWEEWREDALTVGLPEGYHVENERDVFSGLWNSINGDGAWDKNPWVWVIEFKRL